MQVTPRKLRLLIIDDELATAPMGYMVPESIERWSPSKAKGIIGIDSWRTALKFWAGFQGDEVPDLVVADVRFIQDLTSPLSMLFSPHENNIPTGLSHLKTFAVLSRALGLPLGVGTRTLDPTLWQEQIASREPAKMAMGLLAAHEIGEIAAILGDGGELLNLDIDRKQFVGNCLKWLQDNSANEFEDGLRKAVQNYRYRLFKLLTAPQTSNVVIRPSFYGELIAWCWRMESNPAPLDHQHDVGLELTYYNGKRDVISMASLFSDFDGIRSKPLPPSSFAVNGENLAEPWKKYHDGRPRIGAFIKRIGSWSGLFPAAAEAVKAYSVSYPPPKDYKPPALATGKNRKGDAALTAGLTIIFQFMHIEQKKVEQWEYSFEHDSWDPRNLRFISGMPQPSDNLRTALDKLIKLIRKYLQQMESKESDDRFFTRTDLFDEFPDGWIRTVLVDRDGQNAEWVKWHFERLVDAKVLEHRRTIEGDNYALNPDWAHSKSLTEPPSAPRRFPPLVDSDQILQREPNRVKWLRVSLGFREDNFHSLARLLADAFGAIWINNTNGAKPTVAWKGKEGRAILNRFNEPDLPFFILEICREYAKSLNWPKEKWPNWLHEAAPLVEH